MARNIGYAKGFHGPAYGAAHMHWASKQTCYNEKNVCHLPFLF